MHRARTVLNNLAPLAPMVPKLAPERFASWLSAANTKLAVLTSPPRRWYNSPVQTEPFLNGSSSTYVEEMYNSWLADPKSVHVVSKAHTTKGGLFGVLVSKYSNCVNHLILKDLKFELKQ